MKCLVCEQESDSVGLRELPWKIPRKMVEDAVRSRLLTRPIPSEILEQDEIAMNAPLCDRCDDTVRSGEIGSDEIALRGLMARTR